MNDYFEKDKEMLWTMVPKPTMADDMYNVDFPWDINCQERKQWIRNYKYQINETEPVGINQISILKNSKDLNQDFQSNLYNFGIISKSLIYSTLNTTIPHAQMKDRLYHLVKQSLFYKHGKRRYKFLVLGYENLTL